MKSVVCPACSREIASSDVNVAADIAYCQQCAKAFALSEFVHAAAAPPRAADRAAMSYGDDNSRSGVAGLTVRTTFDGAVIQARSRNYGGGIGTMLFATGWWSFLVVFLFASGAPTNIPLPILLFLVPFIGAGVFMIVIILLCFFGVTRIEIERHQGKIFTGAFGIGRTKHFNPSTVTQVEEQISRSGEGDSASTNEQVMIIDGDRRLLFGTGLSAEQRYALVQHLRRYLLEESRD